MVGTLKKNTFAASLSYGVELDKNVSAVLYGYQRLRLGGRISPFELLFG